MVPSLVASIDRTVVFLETPIMSHTELCGIGAHPFSDPITFVRRKFLGRKSLTKNPSRSFISLTH